MSTRLIPTFHPAPNFSVAPPDSGSSAALHLGSVITSLQDPAPLNSNDRVPIPDGDVIRASIVNFSTKFQKGSIQETGIKALILAIGDLGAELGIYRQRSEEEDLFVECLQTEYFNPSPQYLESVANSTGVKTFRKACRDRHPVFLITGLKVAKGASASISKSKAVGASMGAVVPEPFTGLFGIGPTMSGGSSEQKSISFDRASDFVLGYRVTKITFRKGAPTGKPYIKRATIFDNDGTPAATPTALCDFDYIDDYSGAEVGGRGFDAMNAVLGPSRWVFCDSKDPVDDSPTA